MRTSPHHESRFSMNVEQAVRYASRLLEEAGVATPRLDAELLLAHLLGTKRMGLYVDHLKPLSGEAISAFETLIRRRLQHEPLAYIVGEKEFWSLSFIVNPACLIPRPETELLVEKSLELYRLSRCVSYPFLILDLGTGSGAIAVALAKEIPVVRVTATDISPDALKVAKANAERHGVTSEIEFLEGDLFSPLQGREALFDLIVSNPPYVGEREAKNLSREVISYEPGLALTCGEDGLAMYRSIIPGSLLYLRSEGCLVMEVGYDQAGRVRALIEASGGFEESEVRDDFAGIPRLVSARKKGVS